MLIARLAKVECLHPAMSDHLEVVEDVAEGSARRVVGQVDANPCLEGFLEKFNFPKNTLFSCWLSGPLTRKRKFSHSGLAEARPQRNSVSQRERKVLGRNS